ncbi:iron chelate uptake ABC transporter family permease subunit [uncultured Maritimibacter sp.]|uniref:iron chelate uptake ABC transporter family permease subunit n=1 Tax=uncultured Maritimibacter sp. TaxID=991866 RepID=UPI00262DC698|nr:iron chelate uptake ABC transporter family permease subunit [uncultured Maritimibacter sp.]
MLLTSIKTDAFFPIWCDILARTIVPPDDISIGLVTGLIGGLLFVWRLRPRRVRRSAKWQK